ncbi:MAG: sulfatase-like hydrolase/transferase [Armatimonadetes bacterium]|nr:sulfatase-like hydrolase/transferase [Armatimonadota bacterium]NIM24573.1 sulfatase-like hydrolase/transferase [Armatimonadota bacterium]NIM68449.1 sulfatase-like hydrolase/transferase [Armatimonadota bacterium]NIM76835.1 sulfatase-like hydrolase/transferase [Armatimonadota bacterium]NIN06646.1 sulfatase-like hydrolase/transferase [Armatimonadota bacterium]
MLRHWLSIGIAIAVIGIIAVLIVKARRDRWPVEEQAVNLAVGAEFSLPVRRDRILVKSYEFNRAGDTEGWELLTPEGPDLIETAGGMLNVQREGASRVEISNSIEIDATEVNLVELRVRKPVLKFSAAWRIGPAKWSPDFTGSRAISTEEWRTISIPVGQSKYWKGRIAALRIHLGASPAAREKEFQIDSIRLLRDENPSFTRRPERLGYAIADELQWVIPTEVPGKFQREVEIPKGARLSFSYGLSKQTWQSHRAEVMLQVSATTDRGESQPLASGRLQPKAMHGKWQWVKEVVNLEHLAGQRATLTFEASSADEKPAGLVLWGNPILEPSQTQSVKERPNIIVILIDALRPDHLGVYGYEQPTSPNLDELARESIVFENAFAQAQSTYVSVASLFTSLFPLEAKDEETGYHNLKQEVTTLAERLEDEGYVNSAFSTNYFIHWDYGFDRGFETFRCHHELPAKPLTQNVLRWLEDNPRRPFFVYLHFMDTHSPYTPPGEFRSRFLPADYHPTTPILFSGNAGLVKQKMEEGHEFNSQDRDYLKGLYDGEIASVDWNIGHMIERLRKMGLYDNTVIVVLADHGEEFWEHGSLEHGKQLYEELIRVPLIFKLPKSAGRAGERVSAAVQLVDVCPTLLELAGLPSPTGLRGESLLDVDPNENRWQYAEIPRMRALRGEGWKLIDKLPPAEDELYNLREDPAERRNLITEHPQIAAKMRSEMDRLVQTRGPALSAAQEREQIDPKTMERLRALGYIK